MEARAKRFAVFFLTRRVSEGLEADVAEATFVNGPSLTLRARIFPKHEVSESRVALGWRYPLLTRRARMERLSVKRSLADLLRTINTMNDNVIMPDPLAFFITWTTYGTWLPGDDRGWIEFRHGWQLPSTDLERHCRACMTEKQCLLSCEEREIVQRQILETCKYRGLLLIASACRSNHVHLVMGVADCHPNKMRDDIKAWCTRRLREQSRPAQKQWWGERGSNRYIWNEESLATVVQYVTEAQDRKGLDDLRQPAHPDA